MHDLSSGREKPTVDPVHELLEANSLSAIDGAQHRLCQSMDLEIW